LVDLILQHPLSRLSQLSLSGINELGANSGDEARAGTALPLEAVS
jgi:hypothetical protein